MKYYSAIKKNAFESVLMRWMKLEPIIQSEVSQKEKHQYSILTHIYGIRKMIMMTLYVRQQKRQIQRKVFSLPLCLFCCLAYRIALHIGLSLSSF